MSEGESLTIAAPQACSNLYGFEEQESIFLNSFNSGNLAHAWLISGNKGTGKANFCFRAARFILKEGHNYRHQDNIVDLFGSISPETNQKFESIYLDSSNNIFQKVSENTHPDLLVIHPEEEEKDIKVEKIRQVAHFLLHTPSQASWRILIIDSADNMNRNAANALLKLLEEPPARSLIFLISHNVNYLLPTIISRCRHLKIPKLNDNNFRQIIGEYELNQIDDFYYNIAGNSPGIYLWLKRKDSKSKYIKLLNLMVEHDNYSITLNNAIPNDEFEGLKLSQILINHAFHQLLLCSHLKSTSEFTDIYKHILSKNSDSKLYDLYEKNNTLFRNSNNLHLEEQYINSITISEFI